jgi:F0F1-type ATP synthase assembly protein I
LTSRGAGGEKGKGVASATGLLLRMGVGIGLFIFAGYGLDLLFGTSPWFMVGCVLAGSLVMLLDMWRRANRA